jgi:hypothetical protein
MIDLGRIDDIPHLQLASVHRLRVMVSPDEGPIRRSLPVDHNERNSDKR